MSVDFRWESDTPNKNGEFIRRLIISAPSGKSWSFESAQQEVDAIWKALHDLNPDNWDLSAAVYIEGWGFRPAPFYWVKNGSPKIFDPEVYATTLGNKTVVPPDAQITEITIYRAKH